MYKHLLVECHVRQLASITASNILASGAEPHGFILEIDLLVLAEMAVVTQIVGGPFAINVPMIHRKISQS